MKVLVACEFSGVVRDAFCKRGHDATSCDLFPSDTPGQHYQGNVLDILNKKWDLIISHPPCTYLTCSGNKWFKPEFKNRFPNRHKDRLDAIEFFMSFTKASCSRIAIENPIGIMSTHYRKPDQIIQPYMFGDPERKPTCLWLKGLPKLQPTKIVSPIIIRLKSGKGDPRRHFESLKLSPIERMKIRSKTFQGIADAMADQWGKI